MASGVPAAYELPAGIARLRPQIDHPVGALDDFEIVLDHDDRVAAFDQALKDLHEQRDIVEVQTGRRLVEDEKLAARGISVLARRVLAQMRDQFEPLRFAAG